MNWRPIRGWTKPLHERGMKAGSMPERLLIGPGSPPSIDPVYPELSPPPEPCPNQRMVLGFDGAEVLFHLDRVDQRIAPPPSHDDYNSGQSSPVMSSSDHPTELLGDVDHTVLDAGITGARQLLPCRWRGGIVNGRIPDSLVRCDGFGALENGTCQGGGRGGHSELSQQVGQDGQGGPVRHHLTGRLSAEGCPSHEERTPGPMSRLRPDTFARPK